MNGAKEQMKKAKDMLTKNWVHIYFVLMFVVFPLYVRNAYFDITYAKFNFFKNVSILFVVLFFFMKSVEWKTYAQKVRTSPLFFYLLFLTLGAISTVISQYPSEALWGTAGRYNGWMTYFIYGLVFLMLTMEGLVRKECLYLLEGTSFFVSLLAILNRLSIDPLGFFTQLDGEGHNSFSSTLGNIDIVGEYVAVMLVFSGVMYVISKKRQKIKVFHGIIYIMNFSALLLNPSDSSYLGMSVFFIGIVFFLHSKEAVLRYMRTLIYACTVVSVCGLINGSIPGLKQLDGVGLLLIRNWQKFFWIGIFLLGIHVVFLLLPGKQKMDENERLYENKRSFFCKWKLVYGILLGVFIIVALCLFVGVNVKKEVFAEHTIFRKLILTDSLGSGRGAMWRVAWQHFLQMPLLQKLVGMGPDTLSFMFEQYAPEFEFLPKRVDNVHNYYLQLLLGQGILGLGMWLCFIVTSIRNACKKANENAFYLPIIFSIVAYLVMAVVGINSVNVSAIVMLLAGILLCKIE